MGRLIDIEFPFTEEFVKAYVSKSKQDGRQRVSLFRADKTGTFMSYARYLLCVKEGRILSKNEEADHIDNDKTNDSLENLQILTKDKHRVKSISERPSAETDVLQCTYCGKHFDRPSRIQKYKSPENVFCSYSCNGSFQTKISKASCSKKKVKPEDLTLIEELMHKGLSSYKIAEIVTTLSRATICRIMKEIKTK